jgi:hypothetical protein
MHCWQWIQKAHPQLLIFHVPSGEHRSIITAMKLKRMGVVPGVADFLMFVPGTAVAIELKDKGGKQSIEQKRFQIHWEYLGHHYEIARSLINFQEIVESYYGVAYPWLKQSVSTPQLP